MTKKEFIEMVSIRSGVTKSDAVAVVNSIGDIVSELKDGESISAGLLRFKAKIKKGRRFNCGGKTGIGLDRLEVNLKVKRD